jgi:hypothetical protein
MPGSTSNTSVDKQHAVDATAKRKEEDATAAT